VAVTHKALLGSLACALICLTAIVSPAAASPLSLLIPQSSAFALLGHACGGIQEQTFATGFDQTSGHPTGAVYVQTRCGGSGRGGGYHTTTYSAWVSVTWDFAGGVLSTSQLATAPAVSPTFSAADVDGDQLYNTLNAVNVAPAACAVGNTTYCSYRAYLTVPAPAAPRAVTAVQVGDQFQVSWTPAPPNPSVITSSTLAATPVGSTTPAVTTTVSGSASSGLVGPLTPKTTYQITVVSTDAGGSSPASSPITVTTHTASVVPSAPTGVTARWTAPGSAGDTLAAGWTAPTPGDSPIDRYQIIVIGSDGGGTFVQSLAASTLTATFAVSDIPDWSVSVRAHNAAGWGTWSSAITLGGA
jgi:hypothetical protein